MLVFAKARYLLVYLIAFILSTVAGAQGRTQNNEFYFGYFSNLGGGTIGLILMTTETEPVSFSIEASDYFYSGTIAPNGRTTIDIPTRLIVSTSNSQRNGIFLQTSSDRVTVVGQNLRTATSSDTFNILPALGLSVETYVNYGITVPRTSAFNSIYFSAILVVGTKNGTVIRVTPRKSAANMYLRGSSTDLSTNVQYTFIINQLETAYIVSLDELTGTKISTNYPVSVFSGHECGNVPSSIAFCDHLVEQVPPTALWGKVYYVVPFSTRSSYTIKVVAAYNFTAVDIYCNNTKQSYSLHEGDSISEIHFSVHCAIYSNKVVIIAQFSHGQNDDSATGDPMMLLVPSTAHYTNTSDITTIYNSQSAYRHYANIIVPAQFYQPQLIYLTTGGVRNSLQSINWVPIYVESVIVAYAAQVSISEGMSSIVHTKASALMTVTVYGFDTFESYGHTGSLNLVEDFMDDDSVETQCLLPLHRVILGIFPRFGTVLGGTPIRLSGPCFEETDNITCVFNGISVEGKYMEINLALCVSPQFEMIGRIMLRVLVIQANGTVRYEGQTVFYSVTFDQGSEVDIIDSDPYLKCGVPLKLEWPPKLFTPNDEASYASVLVDIDMYVYNTRFQQWENMMNLDYSVQNRGNATVELPVSFIRYNPQLAVIKVSPSADQNVIDQNIAAWSGLVYTESHQRTLSKLCTAWSSREPQEFGDTLLQRLPPCPPNVRLAILDALYIEDRETSRYRSFFHPSAVRCFHQATFTRENEGSGQQCCYGSSGTLLVNYPGGGNVDSIASIGLEKIIQHQINDVLPYIYCCQIGTCGEYYNKRPSDNGRNYQAIPPACVYGDPHIVTLDGFKYTFNGKGEFTLIETPNNRFTLQARMIEATSDGGDAVQATVFSAIVGKQNDSDAVQLELSQRGIDAIVNGERLDFEEVKEQSFNNVTVFDIGNKTIEAIFSSGVLISAKEENNIISVLLVSLSNSYVGSTSGLMGIFNGDTSDDLIPKGSTEPLSLNSSLETIHRSFGITWIINNSADSLFDYHQPNDSWSSYYNPDFTPLFGVSFSDPVLENEAMELCKGDEFCLYDIATTGSMDIGLSTLNGSVSYEEIVETSKPVICNPSCVNGACIANDTCECAMGFSGQICTEPEYTECDVNPCENNATCQSLAGSYICNCTTGFSGLFCEQNVTYSFEKSDYFINEDGGTVELCVLQNGDSIADLTVIASPQEATAKGLIDYNPLPVSVQFSQTDDRKCFQIAIINDFDREDIEAFEVALLPNTGVTLMNPYVATVTITDDDNNRTYDIVEETLYTVPLNIDQHLIDAQPELTMVALCYSVDGRPNHYFNLVSDKCVSVNAYNIPAQRANYFNVISKIGITAVDRDGNCQNIEIDQEDCSATVGAMPITSGVMYNVAGISVKQRRNGYRISVPNCETGSVVLWAFCKTIPEADMLKFIVARGNSLMPTSHGLVGQFWNVPVDMSPYEGITPDNSAYYSVMVTPADGEPRVFIGNLYPRTWDLSKVPCLYAGSSQGGTLGEFGDVNDPVIEGHYSQYMVASLFETQFKYSQFETDRCL